MIGTLSTLLSRVWTNAPLPAPLSARCAEPVWISIREANERFKAGGLSNLYYLARSRRIKSRLMPPTHPEYQDHGKRPMLLVLRADVVSWVRTRLGKS